MTITDILGFVGVTMALGSYVLGSAGRWSFESRSYHVVQLIACLVNLVAMTLLGALPYVLFNVAWAVVAITKLVRLARTNQVIEHK